MSFDFVSFLRLGALEREKLYLQNFENENWQIKLNIILWPNFKVYLNLYTVKSGWPGSTFISAPLSTLSYEDETFLSHFNWNDSHTEIFW